MAPKDRREKGGTALDQIRASLRQFLRVRDLQEKLAPHGTEEPGRPLASDELKHWRDSLGEDSRTRSRLGPRGGKKD